MKKVLVEVVETTWSLLRQQALEEGRAVKVLVEEAFRGYLERSGKDQSRDRQSAGRVERAGSGSPTVEEVRRLVEGVTGRGAVQTGTELLRGGETERASERRLAAARERVREHPEAESQDPRDYEEDKGRDEDDDEPF